MSEEQEYKLPESEIETKFKKALNRNILLGQITHDTKSFEKSLNNPNCRIISCYCNGENENTQKIIDAFKKTLEKTII